MKLSFHLCRAYRVMRELFCSDLDCFQHHLDLVSSTGNTVMIILPQAVSNVLVKKPTLSSLVHIWVYCDLSMYSHVLFCRIECSVLTTPT